MHKEKIISKKGEERVTNQCERNYFLNFLHFIESILLNNCKFVDGDV